MTKIGESIERIHKNNMDSKTLEIKTKINDTKLQFAGLKINQIIKVETWKGLHKKIKIGTENVKIIDKGNNKIIVERENKRKECFPYSEFLMGNIKIV